MGLKPRRPRRIFARQFSHGFVLKARWDKARDFNPGNLANNGDAS